MNSDFLSHFVSIFPLNMKQMRIIQPFNVCKMPQNGQTQFV